MSEARAGSDDQRDGGAPDEARVAAGVADLEAAAALLRDPAFRLVEDDPTRPFDAAWDEESAR